MRRGLILAAMTALVLLLALGLMLLRAGDAPAPALPQTPEAAYRMLYTRSQQDFKAMTVTLASGESYTVESSLGFDAQGNLLGVYNSLGQPVTVAGQSDFALDSISSQMMLLTAVNLPVTASYPGLDPEACGLAEPAARLEIAYHQGEPIRITIGKPAASGYSCYVQLQGDDAVHLAPIDFYQVMTKPLKEHHRLPGAIANPASTAVQIAVVRPGQPNFIAANYGAGRLLPWQVDSPFIHAGSTERIEAFVEAVCAIHADRYAATVQTAQELEAYGLADPTRLLVAFSDGTIRDIHLGHDAGDGHVYARLDTTGDVYLVASSQLPPLDAGGTDALLDRFVSLIAAPEVDSIAVAAAEEAWLLQIRTDADGQPANTINGQAIASELFADVYRAIVGMEFDKTAAAVPQGEPLCDLRFLMLDGSVTAVRYEPFDPHYVLATTSGGGSFLVRRERLDSMLNKLKEATP